MIVTFNYHKTMNVFFIKSLTENNSELKFLVLLISRVPQVKNWYLLSESTNEKLKVEVQDDLDSSKITSLIDLYNLDLEVVSC